MGRFIAVFVVALSLSCSDMAQDCTVNKKCSGETGGASSGSGGAGGTDNGGAGGRGTEGGQGGAGGHGPACNDVDPTASPADDTCVIDEAFGVFVSPDGDDEAGDGTQGSPFATLTKAIAAAVEQDKNVYACATSGDYTEALRLDADAAGLALFGGFDCDTWAYDTETKARIAPGDPHAVVAASADGLELHDLEIVAADATDTSGSSIALQLLDTDAALVRVVLTAGNGAAGEQAIREDFTYPAIDDLAGCDALENTGNCDIAQGGRCTYTCPAGDTTSGGTRGGPSADGGPGFPERSSNFGDFVAPNCGNGGKGEDGPAGSDGDGASSHGTLNESGWTPASGSDGGPGEVGQGGGGGSGGDGSGIGGGGACGGCGGAGAPGSTGGGSSIALLIYNSTTTLTGCTLTTANGGNGGNAQEGQRGQYNEDNEAVAGFRGDSDGFGCLGGNGGIGGNGGASGAGAGGLSVGILYSGPEPTLDESTSNAITTGTAGNGGSAVTGKDDTAGRGGVAQATLEVS